MGQAPGTEPSTETPAAGSLPSANDDGDPGALGLEPFALGQQGAAFDLMLMMLHMGDSVSAALQYNSDLFDEATIARMVGHFQTLLEGDRRRSPSKRSPRFPCCRRTSGTRQLHRWDHTTAEYPRDACLSRAVRTPGRNHPAAIAAECGQEQLTYAELNRRANQLAHYLRGSKVAANDCVGLFVDRSLDMLIGMLGILKAGAAYVPLAPGTPASRIAYMLEASQAPILLTQASLREQLPAYDGQLLCLDDDWNDQIAAHSESDVPPIHTPRDLAYTIFTSGSTGHPQGSADRAPCGRQFPDVDAARTGNEQAPTCCWP